MAAVRRTLGPKRSRRPAGAGTPLIVVVAEGGREPTSASWHDVHLVRRLARDPRVEPIVVSWWDHPQLEALAAHAPVRTPAGPGGDAVASALQARGRHRLAGRVRDGAFGLWLRAHPTAPVVVVGAGGGPALSWLTLRRGPTVWLLGPGQADSAAQADGVADVDHILVPGDDDLATLVGHGIDRGRIEVIGAYHLAEPPTTHSEPVLGVLGRVDDDHGVDLLPRVVWSLAAHLDGPLPVRWARLGGPDLPAMVQSDWARLSLGPLPKFVEAPVDLPRFLRSVSVVVLPWRIPPDPSLLEAIAAAGRPCVSFADATGPAPETVDAVRFPDVAEVGRRLADHLRDPVALAERSAGLADRHGPERTTEHLLRLLLRRVA